MISKDQRFPDAPIKDSEQEYQPGDLYYKCGPRLHEVRRSTKVDSIRPLIVWLI